MSYLTEHDLVRLLRTLGLMNGQGQVIGAGPVAFTDTVATGAVTAAQAGQAFRCAVDAVMTLPKVTAAMKGIRYKFITGALSVGVGLSVSPHADDAIGGAGLTEVLNKDLINTGASDTLTDWVEIECTGIPGAKAWVIRDMSGIWAKEA